MKPGRRDVKCHMLISGDELTSLKALTGHMQECFGLDHRIGVYRGKRPIGLYQWDFDCLLMAIEEGIRVPDNQRMRAIFGDYDVETLRGLLTRLLREYETHYGAYR